MSSRALRQRMRDTPQALPGGRGGAIAYSAATVRGGVRCTLRGADAYGNGLEATDEREPARARS
jgi:hypothetical protein